MSFVYFVPLSDGSAFKVGKSNDPQNRFMRLGLHYSLEPSKAVLLDCRSVDVAFEIEGLLRRTLKLHHLYISKDGGSEMYKQDIFEDSKQILNVIGKLYGLKVIPYFEWDKQYRAKQPQSGIDFELQCIGRKLKNRRLQKNLSVSDVATQLELRNSLVTSMEKECNAKSRDLFRYMKLVDLDYSSVRDMTNEPHVSRRHARSCLNKINTSDSGTN